MDIFFTKKACVKDYEQLIADFEWGSDRKMPRNREYVWVLPLFTKALVFLRGRWYFESKKVLVSYVGYLPLFWGTWINSSVDKWLASKFKVCK